MDGVVLHMHFNWAHTWMNSFWLLSQTPICSSWNFLACIFVSDWRSDPEASLMLSLLENDTSRFSDSDIPIFFQHCDANSEGHLPGWYMYMCFAESLQFMLKLEGARGLMCLADDTMLTRPWPSLRKQFLERSRTTLPSLSNEHHFFCELNINREHSPRGPACGSLGIKYANAQEDILQSLWLLADMDTHIKSCCFTNHSVIAHKAMGDALFIPMKDAADFIDLAHFFYDRKVFEEFALPAIALVLGGDGARVHVHEGLFLHDFWDMDGDFQRDDILIVLRKHCLGLGGIVETPFLGAAPSQSIAFVHPVKIGLHQKYQQAVKELNSEIFR